MAAPNRRQDGVGARHIRIEFGALVLNFQASTEQARNVADALSRSLPESVVTIDDAVGADLPPLPCGRLWD